MKKKEELFYKYKILTGYFEPRRIVTLKARNDDEAFIKCGKIADERCIKRGREPPVAWDMEIIKKEEIS